MVDTQSVTQVLVVCALALQANAQFFNFFGGQQQQQQPQRSFEDEFLNTKCDGYLCPDTQVCAKSKMECPCPFPKSQLKCALPNQQNYVCISKPATHDMKLQHLYDDPVKGPKAKTKGLRDCGWVEDAWNGLI